MLVLGSALLLPLLVIPTIMLFIYIAKLWILYISVVESLFIVLGGLSGWIFTRSSGFIKIFMNLIYCMRLNVFDQ